MNGRKLNQKKSIESLKRKGVKVDDNMIIIPENNYLGNKSWGLIDFLSVHDKFRKVYIQNKKGKIISCLR
jgi:hypothetical protein